MEGSLVAYKVFTNGSTLQASEVNDNLMKQAVATFSNAAARTAAITSPVEGQVTYLEDVDRYDHWNGSAWRSPFGLVPLNTTTITSATTVNVNNVFSSRFDTYKIFLNLTSTIGTPIVFMRMRVGGVDSTVTQYFRGSLIVGNLGSQAFVTDNNTVTADWPVLYSFGTSGQASEITLDNPARAFMTQVKVHGVGVYLSVMAGTHTVATAYDGFTLFSSGAMTGSLQVYGVVN
jgi:hypothetical protein